MIRFHNVYKTEKNKPIINGITYEFMRGKIYCVCLAEENEYLSFSRLVSAETAPTIGEITFYGRICQVLDSQLNKDTEVIVYLEFILAFVQKIFPDVTYSHINIVMEILELNEFKLEKISRLSEFQRQNLKIASALLTQCDILILSSSMLTVSTKIQEKIMKFLQIYKKEATIICLSRKENVAHEYDEMIKIANGRIKKND